MIRCKKCSSTNIKKGMLYEFHDVYECVDCGFFMSERINECCRNPSEVVVKDEREYPLYFIRRQCTHCGGCLDTTKPLSSKVYGNDIRGEFNQIYFDKWKKARQEEGSMLYDTKRAIEYRNSNRYKYYISLNSPEWRAKRKLVLARDSNLCQHCNAPAEEVHHLTYENLGNEPLADLLSLCRVCHLKVHER